MLTSLQYTSLKLFLSQPSLSTITKRFMWSSLFKTVREKAVGLKNAARKAAVAEACERTPVPSKSNQTHQQTKELVDSKPDVINYLSRSRTPSPIFISDLKNAFANKTQILLLDTPKKQITNESKQQIGQSYSDTLAYKLVGHPQDSIEVIKFYRDMKANYRGPGKGHFTLIPYLTTDLPQALDYMNNTLLLLQQKKQGMLEPEQLFLLTEVYNELKLIKLNVKKGCNLKELVIEFNQILAKYTTDKTFNKLDIHITVASDVEQSTDFAIDILPKLETKIKEHYKLFDPDKIIPKGNKPLKESQNKLMQEVLDKIYPEELKQQLLPNIISFYNHE